MTKSSGAGLSRLPKEQVSSFLLGPVSSWFMPNSMDLWTQPPRNQDLTASNESDTSPSDYQPSISYFAYGAIGCFCLGEIYHRPEGGGASKQVTSAGSQNQVGGVVTKLVNVKDDNSRVACVRFQRGLIMPLVLALTESGSLLIYDHVLGENLFHCKKAEALKRFVGLSENNEDSHNTGGDGHNNKRARHNITQQINSCSWPEANNVFLGVSLLKEKKCLLVRIKLNNISEWRNNHALNSSKCDLILAHQKIDLELDNFASPICLIESTMLDDTICLIAVAMDDGFITVISLNLETGKILRTIKLGSRHNDQVCSMSWHIGGPKRKYSLGLLASVSRDGLVLIWDVENEFYFADYLAIQSIDRSSSAKINWFALRFIEMPGMKHAHLAVSNVESGITLLELPENTKSKIRLKDMNRQANASAKTKSNQNRDNPITLKHNALIFNIEFDPLTKVIMTSSLDGNQILWKASPAASDPSQLSVKQQFLITAMPNSARTHMLRHSPIKEDLICMALGKAGVKFASIRDKVIDSKFDMSSSCSLVARRLIKANVNSTSVAWHPNHEYRLAIGTLEGKVYRVDITPRKATLIEIDCTKKATKNVDNRAETVVASIDNILGVEYQPMDQDQTGANKNNGQRQRTDGVYSLCWGPNPACSNDLTKHAIYAIGSVSHTLFIFYSKKDNSDKLTNYLDEFQDTSLPEAVGLASEVAWKSSMDMMALGTTDGRVVIVSYLDESHQERSNHKLFRHLITIQGPLGSVYVQCMAWHPTTDKDDQDYYKIAVSSNESPAFVFNLRETLLVNEVNEQLGLVQSGNGTADPKPAIAVLSCYANKLQAHGKAITDIAWNPHEPNQLATCSFDRTCFVWSLDGSLMDARVIAKFCARDRLFTLDWSLVDGNLIYTSGNDSVVWAWRPTENRHSIVSV